jgi:CSLREA domain-containing protein
MLPSRAIYIFPLLLVGLVVMFALPAGRSAAASTYTVNGSADVPDANPGDGVCETAPGNGVCTLRAAIQETNADPGANTIILQAGVTYLLTRVGVDDTALNGDLDITHAVSIVGAGANSTIIDGNGSVTGEGALQIISSSVNISGVTIQHGISQFGGGIHNGGALTLSSSTITSNTANGHHGEVSYGGGIHNDGTLTLTNDTISGNSGTSSIAFGGGVSNFGTMTVADSTISGNTSSGPGGGVSNFGTMTVAGSTISGNTGAGGGIDNAGGPATLTNSTVSGNTGGGIHNGGVGAGPLIIINSTISHNESTGSGGGIYNTSGTTSLFNVTIANNHADSDTNGSGVGGGVANETMGTFNFVNSIIALNYEVQLPGPYLVNGDCAGTITSHGHNIVNGYNPDHCTINGGFTQADPLLGALQDNGGPTQTHALLTGSPAIDAGDPSGCADNLGAILTADQRGYLRPVDGDNNGSVLCDIGAFEYGSAGSPTSTPTPTRTPTPMPSNTPPGLPTATGTPPATSAPTNTPTVPLATGTPQKALGDVNDDGSVNAIDAALILQYGAGLVTTLPNAPSADVNHSGTVNAIDATLILQYAAGLIGHLPP